MLLTWMKIRCWMNQFSRSACRTNCKKQHQGGAYNCNKEQLWAFRVLEPDSHHHRNGNYLDFGVHSDSSSRNGWYRNDPVENMNDHKRSSWMWSLGFKKLRVDRKWVGICHSPHMTHGQNTDGFTDHHRPRAAINCWLQLLRHFILQRTHMSVGNCQQQHPTAWHGLLRFAARSPWFRRHWTTCCVINK